MDLILLIAATFGVMFLLDKGLTKLLRSRAQHRSGTAVRLRKHYGIFSIALMVLGVIAVMAHFTETNYVLLVGGFLVIALGAVLGVYYLTHGVFYDEDTFLYTTFGSRSVSYRYSDIGSQKLYAIQGGGYVVELFMTDGSSVSIQTTMEGALPFLDKAAHARLRQLGLQAQDQDWFAPADCRWFPAEED